MPLIPGWNSKPTTTKPTELTPTQRREASAQALMKIAKGESVSTIDSLLEEETKEITQYGCPRFKGERGPTINGCTWRQIQFLEIMYHARGPLTRVELCIQAGIDYGNYTALWLGRKKLESRIKDNQGKKHKCLLTKGYAIQIELDIDGEDETSYYISESGRKAFELIIKHPRFPRSK